MNTGTNISGERGGLELGIWEPSTNEFTGGSDSKSICLQCGRPGFNPWVRKITWWRKWQPTPVFLPGKSHGWRNLVGYSPWGHKESDMTEWASLSSTNEWWLMPWEQMRGYGEGRGWKEKGALKSTHTELLWPLASSTPLTILCQLSPPHLQQPSPALLSQAFLASSYLP